MLLGDILEGKETRCIKVQGDLGPLIIISRNYLLSPSQRVLVSDNAVEKRVQLPPYSRPKKHHSLRKLGGNV